MLKCLNVKMNKGFTLIETLIAALIFSIVIGAGIGVFASAIKLQKYNLAHQQLLSQTSYAIEYMSRAIRMAGIKSGCAGGGSFFSGGTSLEFESYNSDYGCQEFSLQNGQLKVENDELDDFLTSDDFEITSLNFQVSGDIPGDALQPRVTISMEIRGKGLVPEPKIKIQTTISQRNLDL